MSDYAKTTTVNSQFEVVNNTLYNITTALTNIEKVGAERNLINTITIGATKTVLSADEDRSVNIPTASANSLGVVKSSDAENAIGVSDDGSMEVNSLNVNKLVQTDEEYIILNGGSSTRLL